MWPSMGSMLHCLWLQKMSLFTSVLKLDSVPTQGLSDSEHSSCPAVQHLAPSWHHAQLLELQELKTLAISETLATSKTGIRPGLLLYLYCSPLPSRTSQDPRNARPRVKVQTAPSSSHCFDHSPAMLLFTNPTCSHKGDTEALRTNPVTSRPLCCARQPGSGGVSSAAGKSRAHQLSVPPHQTRRASPQEQSHKEIPFFFPLH